MTRGAGITVLLVTLLLLTACKGGVGQGGSPPPAGATINVTETEFKMEPKALAAKPGKVTFRVKNAGAVEHNFIVEKTTIKIEAIQPGETKTASGDLKAGQYKVVCNIPGHAEAGMVATLKVGP
jgi:uncharacterized cupredoxin-like copper-binding protein